MKWQKRRKKIIMPDIQVQINDKRYYRRVKGIRLFCQKIIAHVWHDYEPAEISLVLADNQFVWELNKQYRNKDCPTNVLSFETGLRPQGNMPWVAGDIIVAYETVMQEAKAQDKTFEAHLAHLLIHGTLHLQGYDHIDMKDARKMEALETTYMLELGYEDPYKNLE